jgi:hypothetical protein
MKKLSTAVFALMAAVSGAAFAQGSGVTMSTDQSTANAVLQHAQELQSQQMPQHSMSKPMHHRPMMHHMAHPKPMGAMGGMGGASAPGASQ